MKKLTLYFFNAFKSAGLCILALGSLTEGLKAGPLDFLPTPAQVIDAIKSNVESVSTPAQFVDAIKLTFASYDALRTRDIELTKEGGRAFDKRVQELMDFADKQNLNFMHMWVPFMNESDNTLVQVLFEDTTGTLLTRLAEDLEKLGMQEEIRKAIVAVSLSPDFFAQILRYKIRLLTPLEYAVLKRKGMFKNSEEKCLLARIAHSIPEDVQISGISVRKLLIDIMDIRKATQRLLKQSI